MPRQHGPAPPAGVRSDLRCNPVSVNGPCRTSITILQPFAGVSHSVSKYGRAGGQRNSWTKSRLLFVIDQPEEWRLRNEN
jgi:hypothetical protein